MRKAWLLMALAACAFATTAEAQCPNAPSFDAPDWADVPARPLLTETEARMRVHELQMTVGRETAEQASSAEPLRRLGDAYRDLHRANGDEAEMHASIRSYARLIRDFPSYGAMDLVLYRLASGLDQLGQHQRARQVYHRLIRAYPQSRYVPTAYLGFADYYFGEGDFVAATQFYERAAAMNAGAMTAYAHYMSAWCHVRVGDSVSARSSADAARGILTRMQDAHARALVVALDRDRCAIAP